MSKSKCCGCNSTGVCLYCSCVQKNQPCSDCRPKKAGKCQNLRREATSLEADSGDVRLETAESQIKLQKTKHELETAALEETIKEKDCEICVLQEKFETLERELDKSKHELLLLKEDEKRLQDDLKEANKKIEEMTQIFYHLHDLIHKISSKKS